MYIYASTQRERYIYIYLVYTDRVCFHNPKPVQNIPLHSLRSAEQRSALAGAQFAGGLACWW